MKKWNRQQPVTREPGSSAFLEYLAALERDVAAGGGGGGSSSWGSITGTLSAQTDLQTALNGKANTVHTHAIGDVTGLSTALAGVPVRGAATVTVPNNRLEWSETVAAVGVLPSDVVIPTLAPHVDADENDAEMLDLAGLSAVAGTDQITVTLAFTTPAAGAVKINWMAA